MRSRIAWLLVSLAAAGIAVVVTPGCEEPTPPPMTNGLTAAEHDAFFPIDANAAHALDRAVAGLGNINCASCHPPAATFETFGCLSCHAINSAAENQLDGAHASARGYAKEDASCYACHPRGEATPQGGEGEGEGEGEPFDHNTDGFPLPHGGGVGCAQCHADLGGDYSTTLCWGCHQGDASPSIFEKHQPAAPAGASAQLGAIFDGDHSEDSCRECHSPATMIPATFHLTSHDPTMFPTHALSPECKDCHRTRQAEPTDWAIDFTSTGCINTTGCHSQEPECSAANQGGC